MSLRILRLTLAVALALLAGCGGEDQAATPPAEQVVTATALLLQVDEPAPDSKTREEKVLVTGSVTAGARVTVAGEKAKLRPSPDAQLERFSARVRLERGRNAIAVVATKAGAEEASETVIVTRTGGRQTAKKRRASGEGTDAAPPAAPQAPEADQGAGVGGGAGSPGRADVVPPQAPQGGSVGGPPDAHSGPVEPPSEAPDRTRPTDPGGGPPARGRPRPPPKE